MNLHIFQGKHPLDGGFGATGWGMQKGVGLKDRQATLNKTASFVSLFHTVVSTTYHQKAFLKMLQINHHTFFLTNRTQTYLFWGIKVADVSQMNGSTVSSASAKLNSIGLQELQSDLMRHYARFMHRMLTSLPVLLTLGCCKAVHRDFKFRQNFPKAN